jgi:hypothetical protein
MPYLFSQALLFTFADVLVHLKTNLMKKNHPFTILLPDDLIATVAIFNSCSKQETSEPATTGEQPEMSSADQLALNKIFNFRESINKIIENPGLKSTENMVVN